MVNDAYVRYIFISVHLLIDKGQRSFCVCRNEAYEFNKEAGLWDPQAVSVLYCSLHNGSGSEVPYYHIFSPLVVMRLAAALKPGVAHR